MNTMVEWIGKFFGHIDVSGVEALGIKGLHALIVLFLAACVSWQLQRFIGERLAHDGSNDEEEIGTYKSIARVIVWVCGILIAVHTMGFNMKPLFSTGGMLAVAMAFAFKNVAENLLSGLMLRFERVIEPGDVVETEGAMIRIKKIGIRTTIARNMNEEDLLIPNSQLVQKSVANYTYRDPICRVYTLVGVSYTENLNRVRKILEGICEKMEGQSKQHPPEILLYAFGESQVTYKVSIWIEDPWLSDIFRSNLHEAIWWTLKEAGIEMPYPQLEVHLDEGVQLENVNRTTDHGTR